MAQPSSYTPTTDFSAEEADNVSGRSTVRTAMLDAEFSALDTTLDAVLANISLNQRDDGEIRDARVKLHTLSTSVLALLAASGGTTAGTPKGAWVTATAYVLRDVVTINTNTYICCTAHTSGVFATDLAAVKWLLLALGAAPTAAGLVFTPTATLAATNVQTAIDEADTENRALSAAASAAVTALIASLISTAVGAGSALVAYDPTKAYAAGLGQFLNTLYARTTAEIAAGVTPTVYAYAEGDVRRYGATTGATNNTTAINNALLVSATAGNPAFVPAGTWKHTSTLAATLSSSMYGVGPASILNPQTADGITFTNQPSYAGSRFFRDFFISGTTTTAKTGIVGLMTAASGNRVTGIQFSNVTIQNFQYGMNLQGFWNCKWTDCFLYNNYQGIQLTERNIKCTFEDCHVVKGTITGAGVQYAFLADAVGGVRSEDIVIRGCYLYFYDYGVAVGNALYTVIESCDIDQIQVSGVWLVTANGGTIVRNCWINTNKNALTKGIDVNVLGSQNADRIVLDGNHITATLPFAGSIGVAVGDLQDAVVCTNNRINGFETGVKNVSGDNFVCKWNTITPTVTAIYVDSLSANNEIGPNLITTGTVLAFSTTTPPGLMFYGNGSFTITLTGMTVATTGTVNWTANGRTVTLYNVASITGTSNTAAMTGTGLPTYLAPSAGAAGAASWAYLRDNSVRLNGLFDLTTAGVITFYNGPTLAAWTAAGLKGVNAGAMTYPLS